jgi:isopenicillin N synthase-like dioxygenase
MSSTYENSQAVIRRRQVPSQRRRDGLIRYASNTTSQNGEDGIIAKIFDCLPPPPPSSSNHNNNNNNNNSETRRYCVDVGAWDGKHLSNTYSLLVPPPAQNEEKQHSKIPWRGILVEADPARFKELVALHTPSNSNTICVNAAISISPTSPNRLETILQRQASDFPLELDFLSIDIDGNDYWVLEGLLRNSNYRPKLLCIEFNPSMPHDLIYIPPKNDAIRHGASLAALVELALEFDYVLIETTLFNAFFVPAVLYQLYLQNQVPDTSMEALHEVTMGTTLYQLYDGTLKVWGSKKLLWHRTAIDENKLQMLPLDLRQFPFAPLEVGNKDEGFDEENAVVNMSAVCTNNNNNNGLSSSSSSSLEDQRSCADELLQQLSADGFAYVRGTGIPSDLCEEALLLTKAFLTDADETVRRSCLTQDRARRGYSPMCTENFASLIGQDGPNDLVRKFRMGPTTAKGQNDDEDKFSSLLQPNIWPGEETWDKELAVSFQSTMELYYQRVCEAATCIVVAISDAISRKQPDLSRAMNVFSAKSEMPAHTSILTLLGYKVGARHKGKDRSPLVAAHTDVGVITMLLFDGSGCAQLQRSDKRQQGTWVPVRLPCAVPKDPIFVVNIGDCMSELTSNILPSTLHRVVADPKCKDPRHCLALFMGLDPRASLFIDNDTMSYEAWRKRRIARAQEVLSACKES